MLFVFDMRPYSRFTSRLNMLNTFFIVVILGSAALSFSNDANVLVLQLDFRVQ